MPSMSQRNPMMSQRNPNKSPGIDVGPSGGYSPELPPMPAPSPIPTPGYADRGGVTGGMIPPPFMGGGIDTGPVNYTAPAFTNIPGIQPTAQPPMGGGDRMGGRGLGLGIGTGQMMRGQGMGQGSLRNMYGGAGPGLSNQPFRSKLFY